jgi:hypothetical protein
VADAERSGTVNRELQHVFAMRDDRPLTAWRDFDRVELDGLMLIGHDGFAALATAVNGEHTGAGAVRARSWDGTSQDDVDVSAAEVVPAPYLASIAPALRRIGGS